MTAIDGQSDPVPAFRPRYHPPARPTRIEGGPSHEHNTCTRAETATSPPGSRHQRTDRQLFEDAPNGPTPATVTGALRSAGEAVLAPGTTLKPGGSVASGRIRLTTQPDGNLVLYYLFDGKAIRNTGTAGTAIWSSNTHNPTAP